MNTTVPERRRILVTGATGKQGGAVVKALLQQKSSVYDFEILALTRNISSPAAQSLASNSKVTLIAGDLDKIDDAFQEAGGVGSIWGVFSVQLPEMRSNKDPWSDDSNEYRQGAALVDASLKWGVNHFVQTSVDRGGAASDDNPTNVPHFITKHRIEVHLKEKAKGSNMTYTILRPVAFMDNIEPNIGGRMMGSLIKTMGEKPLQLVAVKDIGIFAAQAFASEGTDEYKNTAISLAGDELTKKGCDEAFWKSLHRSMPETYGFLASFATWMVPEFGKMFQWFKDVGYGADIPKCRSLNSDMMDFATWLKQESKFTQ